MKPCKVQSRFVTKAGNRLFRSKISCEITLHSCYKVLAVELLCNDYVTAFNSYVTVNDFEICRTYTCLFMLCIIVKSIVVVEERTLMSFAVVHLIFGITFIHFSRWLNHLAEYPVVRKKTKGFT